MTEVPTAVPPPDDPFTTMPGTTLMELTVVESARVTPAMQRLRLTAPELAGFGYQPGQDIMLLVARARGRPVRRRYTIRELDTAGRLLTLNIVRHAGGGPGERWVAGAGPGATVQGIGPRGKIFPDPYADWHLFIGDESALAAIFTMVQSLPAHTSATVILEIPEPADEQALHAQAALDLRWLPRRGAAAGEPGGLVAAAEAVGIPASGRPHAYLMGEARVVLALRGTLEQRGLEPGQISPKAYWGRGRGNASHGEPARDR